MVRVQMIGRANMNAALKALATIILAIAFGALIGAVSVHTEDAVVHVDDSAYVVRTTEAYEIYHTVGTVLGMQVVCFNTPEGLAGIHEAAAIVNRQDRAAYQIFMTSPSTPCVDLKMQIGQTMPMAIIRHVERVKSEGRCVDIYLAKVDAPDTTPFLVLADCPGPDKVKGWNI